ncbi:hypothetical protein, partial [Enterobacter hormaechei]|uniref:hypothetical protein n=1 Tax=Enterobacter hormaechei TaxID=158836 RepID=UPI001954B93E
VPAPDEALPVAHRYCGAAARGKVAHRDSPPVRGGNMPRNPALVRKDGAGSDEPGRAAPLRRSLPEHRRPLHRADAKRRPRTPPSNPVEPST